MSEEQTTATARPTIITVICILGFIGAGLGLLGSFALLALAPMYGVLLLASVAVGLAALIGVWQMKKWGVYVYTASAALGIISNLSPLNIVGIVVPAVIVAIFWTNINKMS